VVWKAGRVVGVLSRFALKIFITVQPELGRRPAPGFDKLSLNGFALQRRL
jgi:hypothetical protein